MARRPCCGIAGLLIALALAGCATGGTEGATTTAVTDPPPDTSTTTTTTAIATTTPAIEGTTGFDENGLDVEVDMPQGDGPFPAVVLVHGGGWVGGDPSIMRPLARHLNDNGFLTVNTSYQLSATGIAGYPKAVEDVACAVRFAAAHPDSDGTVAIIGHSAGAHIAAVVALTGDAYIGDCPIDGSGLPDKFVGLAGPYDVSRIGFAMAVFFGGTQTDHPEVWDAGNPQLLTDENPVLDALVMYGEHDGLVGDRFAFDFTDALRGSGSDVLLELIEGARHNDMVDPDLVGDLIVTWLLRVTSG